ncbi:MAG: DUF5618 family protein [Dysgonamonadaceae bacterium]|nr:DUF5618 family protein [Dysgonamonadaceae bacterium]
MNKHQHPIREAERYLQNARSILSEKAKKDGRYYHDKKYVRMAGNTAWNGVLIALDATFGIRKRLKSNQRLDFHDYQIAVSQRDHKMNIVLFAAYESLHKAMGYDGNPSYVVAQSALSDANRIVEWADKNYQPTPEEIAEWQRKPNIFQRVYSLLFL